TTPSRLTAPLNRHTTPIAGVPQASHIIPKAVRVMPQVATPVLQETPEMALATATAHHDPSHLMHLIRTMPPAVPVPPVHQALVATTSRLPPTTPTGAGLGAKRQHSAAQQHAMWHSSRAE
ncbi:MAG: hypothetical protein ACXVCX_19540, partial [Ktedonobacterales bacterium]